MRRSASQLQNYLEAFSLKSEFITIETEDFDKALSTIRPSAIRESFIAIPDVKWEEIGGLTQVKRELQTLIIRSLKKPEDLERAGITPPKGFCSMAPPARARP